MAFNIALGVAGLAAMLLLIVVRVPIAYSMILVGFIGTSIPLRAARRLRLAQDPPLFEFSIYDLSVIPMFVLMGSLASRSGLSRDLFRGANAWMGRFRGGVAMAAIAACGGFGAVCGSSLATASTMGQVALPELRRLRYSPSLATGTLAAGGTLGILIPPSVVLIVYAIIIEANIVTLFMAALIPGLIAVAFFIVTIAIYVAFRPEAGPVAERVSRPRALDATLGVVPVFVIFGVVIGGIYAGLYNPTPAAAIGVVPRRPLRLRAAPALVEGLDRVGPGDGAHDRHDLPDPAWRGASCRSSCRAPACRRRPRRCCRTAGCRRS